VGPCPGRRGRHVPIIDTRHVCPQSSEPRIPAPRKQGSKLHSSRDVRPSRIAYLVSSATL
jgi:hypothetical protein